MSEIRWDVAEVLEYDNTYRYIPPTEQSSGNTNSLFAIKVRTVTSLFNAEVFYVRPSNINLKQIPLVGEFVLIYKTFNEYTSKSRRREGWYYVTTIDVHSNINENLLPGITGDLTDTEIANIKPGKTFKSVNTSPLQPYEGDILYQSRFNSSIRLGSTIDTSEIDTKYYSVLPSWYSNNQSNAPDPIIILSNGRQTKLNKEFVVENPNTDASSLYLTSTQTIQLDANKTLSDKYNKIVGSQFIGIADRITLSARNDVASVHSERAIILQTPGEILIGGDDAIQPIPHGNILEDIIQLLICAIGAGCTDSAGGIAITNGLADLQEAQRLLLDLNSKKYKIKLT